MKYLQKFNLFEGKEEKALEKIKKFCKDGFIAQKAVEMSPKLAVWIVNEIIKDFKRNYTALYSEKEMDDYFKNGVKNNDIKQDVFSRWNTYDKLKVQSVVDWSLSPDISPEDRDGLTKMSLNDAFNKADEWHNSLIAGGEIKDEHGKIIMTFPDGFYWIDLETCDDRDEADAMGHCGRTSKGDTIISLRDRKKSPHVTAAIGIKDDDKAIVYQMKGRNNKKPIEKYHKYIVDLLMNDDLVIDDRECTIQGFGNEYDKSEDFSPNDLDDDLKDMLLEKRPDINNPIFSDKEIDDMFEQLIDQYYIDDPDYGFRLVSWVKDVCGWDKVIECLNKRNERLFDILCEKYPDKIKFDPENFTNDADEKREIMTNIASSHIDFDMVEKKYNLDLKKASELDRWFEIFKFIGFEGMEEVLKTNGIGWDKYVEEGNIKFGIGKLKEEFITISSHWGTKITTFEYDEILDYFIPGGEEKQIEVLEELLDGSNRWTTNDKGDSIKKDDNYSDELWDIFVSSDCSYAVQNKYTRKEKEDELELNSWYEYTGYY